MIKEFKTFTLPQKYTVYNALLVSLVNALMVAITLRLVIELFGADGAMLKQYATNIIPLLIIIPFLGRLTSKKPTFWIRIAFIAEILSLVLFSMAELNYFPKFSFAAGLSVILISNTLMSPPRTQINSIIIGGDKDFSIFLEKTRSISLALGSIIGLAVVYFDLNTFINIIGMFISLTISRYFVIKMFDFIFEKEKEEITEPTCELNPAK